MNNYIYEFKDLPSTDTPFNAETFTAMQMKIFDSIFPIGRGFIDFTNTDYSNYLGFTWERELVGLTPVGLDTTQTEFNEIGKTGGEKTHTLTTDEMPSHNHSRGYSTLTFYGTDGEGVIASQNFCSAGNKQQNYYNPLNIGNNQPHNNLPPYKVVAYWKRVA